jgi:hypothetical protein
MRGKCPYDSYPLVPETPSARYERVKIVGKPMCLRENHDRKKGHNSNWILGDFGRD